MREQAEMLLHTAVISNRIFEETSVVVAPCFSIVPALLNCHGNLFEITTIMLILKLVDEISTANTLSVKLPCHQFQKPFRSNTQARFV
jgi:hypothetical protein